MEILRNTLMINSYFNKMRRISITNFNQNNNNKNHLNQIRNIKNFVKYENMFLEDEYFLRAPGSFPDEEEKNYLLKINFIEENNYLDDDNISNNEYKDNSLYRKNNSVNINSNFESLA